MQGLGDLMNLKTWGDVCLQLLGYWSEETFIDVKQKATESSELTTKNKQDNDRKHCKLKKTSDRNKKISYWWKRWRKFVEVNQRSNKWCWAAQTEVVEKETSMPVERKRSGTETNLQGEERAGPPVCPLLGSQKFDGGHFEWHWRVPPEWGAAIRSERKEEKWDWRRKEGKSLGKTSGVSSVVLYQHSHKLSCVVQLTVPGTWVLPVLWPLGPVEVVLRIFFFLRSSSRCSFCLFCTSISSEMKLFFTCRLTKTYFGLCSFFLGPQSWWQ